uniref:C3H1-type domain-containing protein n=1 Tax=Angiostrongylus costaricensis TaxID=334426 RepID=A0A0R3PLF7_ANGCS
LNCNCASFNPYSQLSSNINDQNKSAFIFLENSESPRLPSFLAYQIRTRIGGYHYPRTQLGKSCKDNFCPSNFTCHDGEIFAYCC